MFRLYQSGRGRCPEIEGPDMGGCMHIKNHLNTSIFLSCSAVWVGFINKSLHKLDQII